MALQAAPHALAAQRDAELARLFPAQPTGYLTDPTGVVDAATAQRVTALVERLRNASGAEIAVVVLPTIGDRAAVDVAVAVGRAWGVGAQAAVGDQRRNAGIVLLLVPKREGDPNSGQVFLATGQGLEGIVTDLQAGRVRDLMRPYFQRGEYGAGLEAGVQALTGLIARGMGVTDSALTAGGRQLEQPPERGVNPRFFRALIWLILVIIIIIANISRANRRGPGGRSRRGPGPWIFMGGGGGGGFGGFGGFGGGGGGGFGGFGGGGGFSGGGAGGRF
ncbi:MAG TPA: TPM domain-containing protein [Gemmatimonadales bacterium]|nr:TPM domain-containing protein [Gemmatimonadales bacterium]